MATEAPRWVDVETDEDLERRAADILVVLQSSPTLTLPNYTGGCKALGECLRRHAGRPIALVCPAVTGVAAGAFREAGTLQSVSMQNVTAVGEGAFSCCKALERISLPSVTTVGPVAFGGSALKRVDLPRAATVGFAAFIGIEGLGRVDLPSVTNIGKYAFGGCPSLTTLVVGHGGNCDHEVDGQYTFGSKTLSTVACPSGMVAHVLEVAEGPVKVVTDKPVEVAGWTRAVRHMPPDVRFRASTPQAQARMCALLGAVKGRKRLPDMSRELVGLIADTADLLADAYIYTRVVAP